MTEPPESSSIPAMSESHDQMEFPGKAPGKNLSIWLLLAIAVVGGAAIGLFVNRSKDSAKGRLPDPREFPGVGKVVEGFALEPLIGVERTLTLSDLKGKVVLINVWGPWCGYCHIEMPHLVKIVHEHRQRQDFQFVSISCSAPGAPDEQNQLRSESKEFLDGKGYDFAVHWDPNAKARMTIVAATGIPADEFGYPTTLLLDRNGAVQALWQGYGRGMEAEIAKLVKELLEKKT